MPAEYPPLAASTAHRDGARSKFLGITRSAGIAVAFVAAAGLVAALAGTAATDITIEGLTAGPVVRYGIPVARLLLDLGAVGVVGLALVPKLLGFKNPDLTEPVISPTRRYAVAAAATWTLGSAMSLVLLTGELRPDQMITPARVASFAVTMPAGKGILISTICGAVSWWLARLALKHGERVPAEVRIGVGLFGLLPLPLTGHAANWYYHDLSMVSMELHVTASSVWTGGLAVLVLVLSRHRSLLAIALPKFSTLATWCVFVVGLTGVANGLLELYLTPVSALPQSLWETRYGAMVVLKAVCIGIVGVLALHVRRRILPAVASGKRSAFAAWCGAEVAVLVVAFGIAVVLTRAEVALW